jgi:hypothetical protein
MSSSGKLLLWSADGGPVFVVHGDSVIAIGQGFLKEPIAAEFTAGDSTIETVDRGRGTVVRLAASGQVVSEQALDVPLDLQSASRGTCGWFLGGFDASGDYLVYLIGRDGESKRLHTVTRPEGKASGYPGAHLSVVDDDLLVTSMDEPFRVLRLTCDGEIHQEFEPVDWELLGGSGLAAGSRRWVSLRTVPLDSGYVQTISDLASDKRVLVLYDWRGGVLRYHSMDVPLGIVQSIPSEQLLVAVRRLNVLEVVGYRWRWVASPLGKECGP